MVVLTNDFSHSKQAKKIDLEAVNIKCQMPNFETKVCKQLM